MIRRVRYLVAAWLRRAAAKIRDDGEYMRRQADEIDWDRALRRLPPADSYERTMVSLTTAWAEMLEALAEVLYPLGALVPYDDCRCGPSAPAHPDSRGRIICDRCNNIIAYVDTLDPNARAVDA